jgi:peptidoglycan/xylan/chitin deacetylase (PgdA/CDA1 family)
VVGTLARRGTRALLALPGFLGRRRPGDVVILLYHRVREGPGEIDLPPRAFEEQLRYLVERDRVLSLDEALADGGDGAAEGRGRGARGRGGVVVTFDDGYRDFADAALPLLVRYRVPAVLYLATGLVAEEGGGREGISWSALREAVATGLVAVGSHTHSHADLSRAAPEVCEEEMRRSKGLIEERLGVACRHFAHPYAVTSPAADRAARRYFDSAAPHAWRTNRRGRIDPYRLGRTPVLRSDGRALFRARVRGMLDAEAWMYRAARRGPWRPR